ncbi:replication initiation negative regulator SeqA [Shewanella waksmanii]|uniref:replication initiation negative regulator SeqA n=1 Tax=Shewanella waksmanii TaxID=213783 RepID=UPI00048E0A01|nr:replication initiation negative regulator SeqA [Shewanella waksmanii]
MKYIEVDEELYRHIASKTERIGESASDILRRLLGLDLSEQDVAAPIEISQPSMDVEHAKVAPTEDTPVSFATLQDSIDETQLAEQKSAVSRFLFLLNVVYQATPEQFDQVLQIKGRDRLYFATSKAELLKASKSANPKEIGTSGFWVTTNNNTAKKRTILTEVLKQFDIVDADIEVFTSKV